MTDFPESTHPVYDQTIRASSISELLDCAYRWYAKYVEGMWLPSSAAAAIGSAVHASTAEHDRRRVQGENPRPDETAAIALDYLREKRIDWGTMKPEKAEAIALALHHRYCLNISPMFKFVSVEEELQPLFVRVGDYTLRLTGTLDRIYETVDMLKGILDIKTGGRAVNAAGEIEETSHHVQLGIYELLGLMQDKTWPEETNTAPAVIVAMQTSGPKRIAIAEIERPSGYLIGTKERPGILADVVSILKDERFIGNPRSMLCNPRWCPAFNVCPYRSTPETVKLLET